MIGTPPSPIAPAGRARAILAGGAAAAAAVAVPTGGGPLERLNDEQRQMVLAMAEPLLRADPGWPSTMRKRSNTRANSGRSVPR